MITGSSGYAWRSSLSVASPSISGISTSSVTTSGRTCRILASAMRPLGAVPITSRSASADRRSLTSRRTSAESSTTRMRVLAMGLRLPGEAEEGELRLQHVGSERLHQVLVDARLERLDHPAALELRRDHDHLQAQPVAARAHSADEVQPAATGKVPVHQREVDRPGTVGQLQ